MNKTKRLSAYLLCFSLLSGCACFDAWRFPWEDASPAPEDMAPVLAPDASIQVNIPTASNDFVNYTEVAADYREYGERTPRDRLIVQAGAGSNVSASIPPTIDEEVADYEEEMKLEENSDNSDDDDDNNSTEDPVEDWLAEEGNTLKTTLSDWSDRAGWRLIWNSNRNYKLTAGAMFRGRFADVSSALIRAFARARPAPIATFYKGNRVLVVETLEDENAYE